MTEVERRNYEYCRNVAHGRQTNFRRITATPEALAEFIEEKCNCINCPTECPAKELCNDYRSCRRAMVMWLKQESDTE